MNPVTKEDDFDLHLKGRFPDVRKYLFAFFSLGIALLIIYSNSFYGEWHFDDFDNIVWNRDIQITSFTWDSLDRCFHGMDYPYWIRPLSYLSFALNYHYDGLNVVGYHLVNFAIHFLAAGFLFLFLFKTLQLPLLKDRYGANAYSIALLATFLWALNPIQVSTVSFIVQRMAGMSGLFTIMVLYFYLSARTAEKRSHALGLFVVCTVLALLGFATKENTAMLPFTLFLFDLFLIQGISKETLRKNLIPGLLCALAVLLIGFAYTGFASPIGEYKDMRPFTMWERLLTQPRVILFYIGLLLYPANVRLMLLHDMDFSKNLLEPWTTLPAMGLILLILAFALLMSRKRPLASFCIIFFFLNHVIEGSFIALELVYEHRNYVPAMLFFVPVAIFILQIIDHFSYRRSLQAAMACGAILILVFLGDSTYTRNEIFRTEFNLWMDNTEKAPRISRTHNNLGKTYWELGMYNESYQEFIIASRLRRDVNLRQLGVVQCNLGLYFLEIKNQPREAIPYFQRAVKTFPEFARTYTSLAKAYVMEGNLSEALRLTRFAVKKFPRDPDFPRLLSLVLLKNGKSAESIREAKALLQSHPEMIEVYPILGEAYRREGQAENAAGYWERYLAHRPDLVRAHLALVELYSTLGKDAKLLKTVEILWCLKKEKTLTALIEEAAALPATKAYIPEKGKLLPLIRRVLRERVEKLAG
jgi:tetratricopeptide (TPR) repeat protein